MTDTTIRHIATVFPIDPKMFKTEAKFNRRRSIIREFSVNTSTHGIPGIARSQNLSNRLFWTAALLIFTGVMIFFISASIRDYFQYPTQTSVTTIIERTQKFPAVTFCNYSPLRYDLFIQPFRHFINATNTTTITLGNAPLIRDFIRYRFNSNQSIDEYLFTVNTLLISCDYNGDRCSPNDFLTFFSPLYGACFTFNAKLKTMDESSLRLTTDKGGNGLLQLKLYSHSHLYVPFVSEGNQLKCMNNE